MFNLTEKELNGLSMGVIDLYRQYCPENNLNVIEILTTQVPTEQPLFRMASKKESDTPKNKTNFKDKKNKYSEKIKSCGKDEISDNKKSEKTRLKLAEEKARTASTYRKLEKIPEIQTAKSNSRKRLVQKRSKGYTLFNRIGVMVDSILGKKRPKKIQYTDVLNEIPLAPTFNEMLINIIVEKNLDNSEVYKKAKIDKRLFSKIISNQFYKPSRKTVLCLVIALELDMDEASDLMATAGFAFTKNDLTDVLVEYFIRTQNYDISQINEVLYKLKQDLLTNLK